MMTGTRAVPSVAATDSQWLKLGIAAALGVVAGTMLFATEAEGWQIGRRRRDQP